MFRQNMAQNAQGMASGTHPGYEPTALDGLLQTLEVVVQRRIKIVVNGGALNPKGLAEAVRQRVNISTSEFRRTHD